MKKSYNPISDVRNENVELTRRLYRAISDASRHLDDRRGRAQTCSDLFLPNLETQRVKLREYCERLIFSDPVGYGRKGEELLWRKGYYDVVTTAKRLRKNNTWSPAEIAFMQGHLSSGIGHYHHLLFRLQIEYKLDLRGIVDFPLVPKEGGLAKDKTSSKTLDSNCVEWAKQAVHRCLVYLGDLCRYVLDLHPRWDTGLAVRYYLQALNMNVDIGMPHNQLGTLSGTSNHGLDAAYHYMRCLMCKQSFEGAEGNLQRLLGRNAQWSELHLNNQNHNDDDLPIKPAEHVHHLIARFMLLIDVWFFDKAMTQTEQVCNQMLQDLQQCLRYSKPVLSSGDSEQKGELMDLENVSLLQVSEEDQENPEYLRDDLILKMVVMLLLCITNLKSKGSQQESAVVAFTLAMFSQLVQQVILHIQDSVFNISFPLPSSPPSVTPSTAELNFPDLLSSPGSGNKIALPLDTVNSQQSTDQSCINENTLAVVNGCDSQVENAQEMKTAVKKTKSKSFHRLRRRRRRRRKNSSEESDLSDDEFPYGDGSSSSDEGNSDISENPEPEIYDSSDDDEDDDEDVDEKEDEPISEVTEKKSDSLEVKDKTITNGKLCNHFTGKEELKQCNGLISHNNSLLKEISCNGLEKDENDSLIISCGSSNNFESALSRAVSEEKEEKNAGKKNKKIDPADLLELVADEGLLDAVKVCADWLHGNSDIIKACGRTSRTLLSRFITMLNLINMDADNFEKGSDIGQFPKLKNVHEVFKKVPLPEDVMLRGLTVLKSIHGLMDWEYLRYHSLHAKEEALLRVYKLVDFGHLLTSIADTGVTYDAKEKIFRIESETEESTEKAPAPISVNETINAATNSHTAIVRQTSNSQKGQLMHHMGQLWLRAEVHDLESRVRRRGASFSPYLAVDSDALIHYIHLVKQLVGARKFIILIPSVVVSALDELKREIGKAREAIRWLESQFQRGNRFLRAQRSHERLPLPLMKYPKKKDKEAWLFFQVVECCHYFSQQTGVHETHPETALVTLLTGQKSAAVGAAKEDTAKGFSPLGVAKSAGINLEHIESFHAKWKTSSKSHG